MQSKISIPHMQITSWSYVVLWVAIMWLFDTLHKYIQIHTHTYMGFEPQFSLYQAIVVMRIAVGKTAKDENTVYSNKMHSHSHCSSYKVRLSVNTLEWASVCGETVRPKSLERKVPLSLEYERLAFTPNALATWLRFTVWLFCRLADDRRTKIPKLCNLLPALRTDAILLSKAFTRRRK